MASSDEKIKKFQWSLKPLIIFLKCVGISLNISDENLHGKVFVPIIVSLLGFCIILANLYLNGPRGIEYGSLEWMKDIQNYESVFIYFYFNSFAIVKLVKIISNIIFFCYVPLIHFTFILSVLWQSNWSELKSLLRKIQNKMKLNEEFHRKLRWQCFTALLLLFLVYITLQRVHY